MKKIYLLLITSMLSLNVFSQQIQPGTYYYKGGNIPCFLMIQNMFGIIGVSLGIGHERSASFSSTGQFYVGQDCYVFLSDIGQHLYVAFDYSAVILISGSFQQNFTQLCSNDEYIQAMIDYDKARSPQVSFPQPQSGYSMPQNTYTPNSNSSSGSSTARTCTTCSGKGRYENGPAIYASDYGGGSQKVWCADCQRTTFKHTHRWTTCTTCRGTGVIK